MGSGVTIEGPMPGLVWVSPSVALASRILRSGFGSGSDEASELEETTLELCNIVAGNLKALLPRPSVLGLPRFQKQAPAQQSVERRFALTVDGEPLSICFQRAA